MNRKTNTKLALGISAAALVAMSLGAAPAMAHDPEPSTGKNVVITAALTELNGSGASGRAIAVVREETIRAIGIRARGLSPDAPHAQHIHYGEQPLNECPRWHRTATATGGWTPSRAFRPTDPSYR